MARYTYVTETVPPEVSAEWKRKRRNKDEIDKLPDGFSFKARGRLGFIYYREGGRIVDLGWEMSGVPEFDILLNMFGLRKWVWPREEPVTAEDRERIRNALDEWLRVINYRAQLSEVPC